MDPANKFFATDALGVFSVDRSSRSQECQLLKNPSHAASVRMPLLERRVCLVWLFCLSHRAPRYSLGIVALVAEACYQGMGLPCLSRELEARTGK